MKVILNQDISGLGEEGDIKEVADGYARNYLIPKNLVAPYSKQSLNQLERKRSAIEKRKEEKRQQAMSLKEKLEADELLISMPAGESGKLFGSVNNLVIAQELEKKGYQIEKKRVEIPDHTIRTTGNYTVKIKLYGQEEARLRVVVEKSEKPAEKAAPAGKAAPAEKSAPPEKPVSAAPPPVGKPAPAGKPVPAEEPASPETPAEKPAGSPEESQARG